MKKLSFTILSVLVLALLGLNSCKQQTKATTQEANAVPEAQKVAAPAITIEKLTNSPAYATAALQLNSPATGEIAAGPTKFDFTVSNYELGAQTMSPNAQILANSGKGQHIHFILNNQPYSAHYTPNFEKELPEGVHHLVAFLSRSYHESVKNENSVVVKKMIVGNNPTDSIGVDENAPTLIYSRPKGTYKGKDGENLLLDFFVLNTTLSENGNKVKATINGTQFLITEWVPHVVKGLPKGEVTVNLELIDAQGNLIPGPFNKVTRTVVLAP